MTANSLAPTALLRAAQPLQPAAESSSGSTGAVAAAPQGDMAEYGAPKAALGARLIALRREQRRRGVRVADARLGHRDTRNASTGAPYGLPAESWATT
ncbi:hypothetical protein [Streptomyces yanii]|uniref:Uncharacterized protein n=1 Tax=Streptomyces yanii TaxID=78510 RepID=A0ABV5R6W1_9ACTN